MYQILCDGHILYDLRDEELIVLNPKCTLEVNKAGEASFSILPTHPFYNKLVKLKSVFEIRQNDQPIFRGRMTNDSRNLYNQLIVDLEGALAYTNDSLIMPFRFPDDFPEAATAANVVEYFLGWILDQHNAQVQSWQQLKLGKVTVSDPNNVLTRSSTNCATTLDTLKSKLFDSALGGYLYIRYESDGNYVDYVSEFELTNTQRITFGENLLDIKNDTDASETYSAIFPTGATVEEDGSEKQTLNLMGLENGNIDDDLVLKDGFIYSQSAVAEYGWICVPPDNAKWTDVHTASLLKSKAVAYLSGMTFTMSNTMTFKALDLGASDAEIESFRICRNVIVDTPVHGVSGVSKPLTKLDIDMADAQNTTITVGATVRTLLDVNDQNQTSALDRVQGQMGELLDGAQQDIMETVHQQLILQETSVISNCTEMILGALEQYVETGEYNEFKSTVQAQLAIMADEILMGFTTTTEQITNVDGDLQAKFQEIYNYIRFSEDGITLGSSEDGITLHVEHDQIVFKKDGVRFGSWDGVDFYTGNIVVQVNERAQFGNFAFIPRSDGSLMFLKVGGD